MEDVLLPKMKKKEFSKPEVSEVENNGSQVHPRDLSTSSPSRDRHTQGRPSRVLTLPLVMVSWARNDFIWVSECFFFLPFSPTMYILTFYVRFMQRK